MELRVRKLSELNTLVEFFATFPLQTKKRQDFKFFREIISMMNAKEHLTADGLRRIAQKAAGMNRQNRRWYLESPETIRLTGEDRKI